MPDAPPADLAGRHALVLGLGRFSGGVETARFLRDRGAEVTVSDRASREALEASAETVERLGAALHFGEQTPALLEGKDLVVASPAIPFEHEVLRAAEAAGIPVTTEINLFLERVRAPVWGVTGTKGKSTTATLLAAILEEAGRRVHLGGNVGRSLIAAVDDVAEGDVVVLELSSFQLWWARRTRRSPHVSVVTNLFADHLDRHGTYEHYVEAKRAALDFQGPDDVAVLPADDEAVRKAGFLAAGEAGRVLYGEGGAARLEGDVLVGPGGERVPVGHLPLPGEHNRRNLLAAATAALAAGGADGEAVARAASAARALPHRLEPVAEAGGVRFVDDSNATTPRSVVQALAATPGGAVVLVGGKDKGVDATELVEALRRHAAAVVGIGTTGPAIVEGLRGHVPAVAGGRNLAEATRRAALLARPGQTVLLSPGHASLDEHASFAERGERFADAARALAAAGEDIPCTRCGAVPATEAEGLDTGVDGVLVLRRCEGCREERAESAARG